METEKSKALEAFQAQTTEAFRSKLYQRVIEQSAPFALYCLYVDDVTGKKLKGAGSAKVLSNWHRVAAAAISHGTKAEQYLIVDNDNHIAFVVSDCSHEKSDELARLIRTRLMQDYPSLRPSLAVSQVSSTKVDVDNLLAELCANLGANIQASSSAIEVTRY